MKANELRSGNYVLSSINTKMKIDGFMNDSIFMNVEDERVRFILEKINYLQPIKLTEKIISEICGELNELSGDYRIQVTDDYSMSFAMDNDMIYIGDLIEIRISETPLHRLQNLYLDLAGRELTVP